MVCMGVFSVAIIAALWVAGIAGAAAEDGKNCVFVFW